MIINKLCRNLKITAVGLTVKVDTAVPIQTHPSRLLTAVILLSLVANMPVPMAALSKGLVCGRSPAENVGSNPRGGMDVCRECCVLSARGPCDELITHPDESCRLWCVVVCDLETS